MAALDVNQVWPGIEDNFGLEGKSSELQPWTSLENICDYKTSSRIAHQYRRPPSLFHEPPATSPCKEGLETDLTILDAVYQTTYRHDFELKFKQEDIMRNADRPAFRKFQFMQTPSERLKFVGRRECITATSEYLDKFGASRVAVGEEPSGRLQDFSSQVHYPEADLAKRYRPLVPLDSDSAAKYVDPYISTAQMDFNHKTQGKIEKLNSPVYFPKSVFPAAKPLRERAQCDAVLYRTQPKRLEPMISTTHEDYRKRLLPVEPRPPCAILPIKQTLGDAVRTPGMYHTDYSHIGSTWHPDILVDHQ